jgi:ATP-dependent helicase/DNAse subunit B
VPLKLVTGPANSAKAGVVLDALRARRRQEPWLVVPTRDDVVAFERELSEDTATAAGRVTTFAGLVREVARRANWWARSVGPLQRERLVAQAIADAPLDALAPVASASGFLSSALAFVAELERSLITPQRFTAAVRAWAEAPPAAHEATAIYDRYMRALERFGRVDPELFAWRALDALRARPRAWGTTPVFLYGFDDLTPLERDAVETLAKIADAEVTVSLTYEPGRTAFAGRSAALVQELGQLASEVTELPAEDAHYAPESRAALHHVERHLFEPAAPPAAADGAVELLVAGGERAEAELVAAELLRLLGEQQIPAEQIAVVLRAPERGAALLEHVLTAYGVPYALQRRIPFAHAALGRGLLALARCALDADEAGPADLLAYLRTPGRLERLELADRLELVVRRRAVAELAGARRAWEEANPRWPLREIDRLRGAAADGVQPLLAALAREARALFAAPHRAKAAQLNPAEEVDARALATLLRALDELSELAAADPRRALQPDVLLGVLARLEVPVGTPLRAGAVLIADPLAIRARRFDTVILCGRASSRARRCRSRSCRMRSAGR